MSSEFVILSDSVNVFFFLKKHIIKCHFFIFYHCVHFSMSQWSLWSTSSSSFLISALRWLMFSLLAFSLSFSSVISWLVLFFAASIFSLVLCSSSLTANTHDHSNSNHVNAAPLYRCMNFFFPHRMQGMRLT